MAKKTEKTDKQEEIKDQKTLEETLQEGIEQEEREAEEAEEELEEQSREEELEQKLAELQDKYMRLTAEYDNYRKRSLKERMELQEHIKEEVFLNLLPVIDDLERAMDAVKNATDLDAVKQGMELIYSKFSAYLGQQGVKEIEALNKAFDTDLHEAITKIPVESKKKKGKVVDVIEKGYLLREKVIRFAKVVIGE